MSDSDLAKLEAEEQALLAELRRKREELQRLRQSEAERVEAERKRMELEKPIVIRGEKIQGGLVMVQNDPREDLLAVLRSIQGRIWNGFSGKNGIPIGQWASFKQKVEGLPNVTFKEAKGLEDEINWWLTAPPWEVVVHPSRRHLIAKAGPRQSHYTVLNAVPGSDWDESSKSWRVPLSEGWRLYEALSGIEGVIYEPVAQELILKQVESRLKLDLIVQKTDSDFFPGFTQEKAFKLKPFQNVGVEFAVEAGGRVILADATGLGKTAQALAVSEWFRTQQEGYQTVVSCRAANIPDWIREIRRLTGEEPLVCKGGKPDFFMIKAIMTDKVPYVIISHDTLGTYQTVKRTIEAADGTVAAEKEEVVYTWTGIFKALEGGLGMLIVDEGHKIKNPDTHRSRAMRQMVGAQNVMILTASPVMNRTEELWPLLFMVNPHVFASHSQFIDTYTYDNGRRPRRVKDLHELMRPIFLRRTKAQVLPDLPPINRVIRYHDLSDRAAGLYAKALAGVYEQLEHFDPYGAGAQMSIMSVLARIMRLKQICAADKTDYTADLATELVDQGEPHQKVLIFTQFKGTAFTIARKLGHEAVCTVEWKHGKHVSMNVTQRSELFLKAERDPSIRYLVVTSDAAQEGHNLQFCDWVIFNDPLWTPLAHDQCEGRAYGRLSNPHAIDSFYIIADIEVERWIMELLEDKLAIIQEAVEGIESSREVVGSVGMELIKKMKEAMWSSAA